MSEGASAPEMAVPVELDDAARRLALDAQPQPSWLQDGHVLTAPHSKQDTMREQRQTRHVPCRYFATKSGCRAGDTCTFIHDPSRLKGKDPTHHLPEIEGGAPQGEASIMPRGASDERSIHTAKQSEALGLQRKVTLAPVDRSRIVPKPISRTQIEDPRAFQLQQLRRRFSPKEASEENGTTLTFRMVPSDPDFPFEMAGLECTLHVPQTYPTGGIPSLDVHNKEMDRGYQINVERGFDALVRESPQSNLLGLMNALDRQLELLLTEQKAETIKIIRNADPSRRHPLSKGKQPIELQVDKPAISDTKSPRSQQLYTADQKNKAQARREMEIRQLEARLGRLPSFNKSSDGIEYTIPMEPSKKVELPVPLQMVKKVSLFVPLLYPLQPCRVQVQGVADEAAVNVKKSFEERVKEKPDVTLMGHINYLSQNMHVLAKQTIKEEHEPTIIEADTGSSRMDELQEAPPKLTTTITQPDTGFNLNDRSRLIVVPRPPEWTFGDQDDIDSDSSDSYDTEEKSANDSSGEEPHAAPESSNTASPAERGILLSFPYLELHNVELLELTSLSITVKCDRCKDTTDISNLRSKSPTDTTVRMECCKKCANALNIGYRKEMMHVNSIKAGYLDIDGATVLDMLPSNFVPVCGECSTAMPSPGVVSVRGESSMSVCRECHSKMSFKIPEIKFLLVSSAAVRAIRAPPRKKVKESLGITAGQELPRRGRCKHYSKSCRWFRFSCCSKVFPCDKCHDEQSDHPNEHANRMICGLCSREQAYRPENCGICHASLIASKGSGFWEGGKGTRDKTKMSRKDPRKFKRQADSAPRKKKDGK